MRSTSGWLGILGCGFCLISISHTINAAPKSRKPAVAKANTAVQANRRLLVQGRVVAATRPPRPGSVPYKDAVIAVRLNQVKAVQGRIAAKEIVVFTWGMRRNKRTPMAALRNGQVVRFYLTPWEKAERKYGSYNRFELQGNDVFVLDEYWGESK
jgi:hypothetical protein